jgi:hypothetical protein
MMRKILSILVVAAAMAISVPASSNAAYYYRNGNTAAPGEIATGTVAGTTIGLGVSEGWWGSTIAGAALPTTVAGAAVVGGVAGIGAVALVDAFVQPCRGFAALFDVNSGACVNGHYVGYEPRHVIRR